MFYPRLYQTHTVDAFWDYFVDGGRGNPFASLPTGTGKSLIPAMFFKRAMAEFPKNRFLLLTHVKELIEQDLKALRLVWPTAPVGTVSAGLNKNEPYAPIVYGGIQTTNNAINDLGHRDIMFIDEAHLLSPRESSMYQRTIAQLLTINPCMKVLGLSATPFRMGQGHITDGGLFTDMTTNLTSLNEFIRFIDDYYLSQLIPKRTDVIIDVSDVRQLAYDFNQGDLQATIQRQNITREALTETCAIGSDRKRWLIFAAGIENAEQINDMLNNIFGVRSTVVHSKMSDTERDYRIAAYKFGHFKAIVSNNILTTGFDDAETDLLVDLRPTTSIVLHVQKYGRGTRPFYHPSFTPDQLRYKHHRKEAMEIGGKRNCLVLDFAGNTERLGPINDPTIPQRRSGRGSGEVPIKICPNCGAFCHISARICDDCEQEFIFRSKIKPTASDAEIIVRNQTQLKQVTVDRVLYKIHTKKDKPDSLRVTYQAGFTLYDAWLGFESTSAFAQHKAHEWWKQHSNDTIAKVPVTASEAHTRWGECREAKTLLVDTSGKYPNITEYMF